MVNPPYGERIEVAGKAAGAHAIARPPGRREPGSRAAAAPAGAPRPGRRATATRRATSSRAWPRTGSTPTPRTPPAGRLDPQPRHAPAERDAAEGVAPRADVERADRVPPVPLRPRRRLGARPRRRRSALGLRPAYACRRRSARPSQASSASGAVSARSDARAEADRHEAAAQRQRVLLGCEPAFGSAQARSGRGRQHRRRQASGRAARPDGAPLRAKLSSQRAPPRPAVCDLVQPSLQAQRRCDPRHAGAAALLGCRRCYRLPVAAARLGALAGQAHHRAGAEQRLHRGGAELGLPSRPRHPCARWPVSRCPR